jgi:hypothetical protein
VGRMLGDPGQDEIARAARAKGRQPTRSYCRRWLSSSLCDRSAAKTCRSTSRHHVRQSERLAEHQTAPHVGLLRCGHCGRKQLGMNGMVKCGCAPERLAPCCASMPRLAWRVVGKRAGQTWTQLRVRNFRSVLDLRWRRLAPAVGSHPAKPCRFERDARSACAPGQRARAIRGPAPAQQLALADVLAGPIARVIEHRLQDSSPATKARPRLPDVHAASAWKIPARSARCVWACSPARSRE